MILLGTTEQDFVDKQQRADPSMLPLNVKHRSRSPPPINTPPLRPSPPSSREVLRRPHFLLLLLLLLFLTAVCGVGTLVLYSSNDSSNTDRVTNFWRRLQPASTASASLEPQLTELLWPDREWQPLELKGQRLASYLGEQHQQEQCRVSKQGRQLVVDDRGVLCDRQLLHPETRCCSADRGQSTTALNTPIWRYTCHHCQPLKAHEEDLKQRGALDDSVHAGRHGSPPDEGVLRYPNRDESQAICCSEYEGCVSCCMEPLNRGYLRAQWRNILTAASPSSSSSSNNVRTPFARYAPHIVPEDWFTFCSLQCRTDSASVVNENTYRHADLPHCFGYELLEGGDERAEEEKKAGPACWYEEVPAVSQCSFSTFNDLRLRT